MATTARSCMRGWRNSSILSREEGVGCFRLPGDFEEYFWKCYNINLKEFRFCRGMGVQILDNSRSAHEMQACSSTKKQGYSTMSQLKLYQKKTSQVLAQKYLGQFGADIPFVTINSVQYLKFHRHFMTDILLYFPLIFF